MRSMSFLYKHFSQIISNFAVIVKEALSIIFLKLVLYQLLK